MEIDPSTENSGIIRNVDMNNTKPSRLALRFLAWFCPPSLYEGIEGDLMEQFEADAKLLGEKKAKRRFIWNAIKFLRPGIILRNRFAIKLNQWDMLLLNLKFALRAFLKDKLFSGLNALGLALGIATSIILLQILQNDFTLYNYFTSKERPADLGYYMGYQIAKEYYKNASDKKQAISDIIEMNNPLKFLELSRYDQKAEE